MSISPNPPVLVLDTNVCLDLFVFHDPRWELLMRGLADGRLKTLTNSACREEWLAVLQYSHLPVSDLTRSAIIDAFDKFIPCLSLESSTTIKLPVCKDPDDQKFLELARDGKATHLITKDKALLKCGKKVSQAGLFQIMEPQIFLKTVQF